MDFKAVLTAMAVACGMMTVSAHARGDAPEAPSHLLRMGTEGGPEDGSGDGSGGAEVGPPTHIYATDWGLTLKADGTGFYNDLARFLLTDPELGPVDYEILPYRRANRSFVEDKKACKYPSNLQFNINGGMMETADGYLAGAPVILTRVHLFSQPGTKPPTRKADVNGKTIAYAMGARTPALFRGENAFFIAVADEVAKAQMLLSGRVDMITATVPDVEFVFRKLKVKMAPYTPGFSLDISAMGVDCHDTPANAAFIARFNARVARLIKSGALKAFFIRSGLDPAVYMPPVEPAIPH